MARWWFLEMFGRKHALAPPKAKGRSYRPSFEVLEDRVVPATIAYAVPSGTVGSQNFGGPLGMDFDVNQPIAVTELGVFDSGSDGLSVQLGAALYNRDTQALMAQLTFAAGTTGTLIGGSRFLPLSTPLFLPAGCMRHACNTVSQVFGIYDNSIRQADMISACHVDYQSH